jgi:hypothetical protein
MMAVAPPARSMAEVKREMNRRANIKWRLRELHFSQKKQHQIWAATVIQTNWRVSPSFLRATECNNRAALCLQRHWKKHVVRRHARRELMRRRDLVEREKSATLVQRRYRGVLARKKMRQYHSELAELHRNRSSAETIQRCERGRVARLRVNQIRAKMMVAAESTGAVQGWHLLSVLQKIIACSLLLLSSFYRANWVV